MAISKALTELLEANLKAVEPPKGYQLLRDKLIKSQSGKSSPSTIQQSRENSLRIEDFESDKFEPGAL